MKLISTIHLIIFYYLKKLKFIKGKKAIIINYKAHMQNNKIKNNGVSWSRGPHNNIKNSLISYKNTYTKNTYFDII